MKVLLAIDQFHRDSKSVKLAKQCLEQVDGSELTVLYVSSQPTPMYYRTPVGSRHLLTDKELAYKTSLETELMREFHPWDGQVRFRHEFGLPAKVICDVADEERVDMVIVGCPHHHGDAPKIGSVVQGVLKTIDRPVLVAT